MSQTVKKLHYISCNCSEVAALLTDAVVAVMAASAPARRTSILAPNRKISTDFARKLSAISVASDVSCISDRFGLEQGELKNIVQDILDLKINDDWDVRPK